MSTATYQVTQAVKATEEAVDEIQNATASATSALFDTWTRVVRIQQQLTEAEIKFWFKVFSAQFPR